MRAVARDVAKRADRPRHAGLALVQASRIPSIYPSLHVLPELRGRSIGERLLRSAARQLKHRNAEGGLHLWVFEANEAGLRFYLRLGGRVVQRDVSRIPAANGKTVLRVHWPEIDALG